MASAASRIFETALRLAGLSKHVQRSIGYDGASGGRRLGSSGQISMPLASQVASRSTLSRRARYFEANNGFAHAGVDAWVSALTGCGIRPQSNHPDPEMRKVINASFDRWTRTCDYDGLCDFYGLQSMISRRMVVDGECFCIFIHNQNGKLALRLIDGEQVNGSYHQDLSAGARIIAGVEYDETQRRVAYHMFKQRPGLPITMSLELIRVQADLVCHVFRAETPGQIRGVSWLAPILLRLNDLDAAHDAQIMRQKTSALYAGFIVDPNGDAGGFDGTRDGAGNLDASLEPGSMKVLLPGQDVRFSEPAAIGQEAIEFLKITAREIAAGIGVPYEAMTGDLSSVNYSSIRAGLVEFRRRVEALQDSVVIARFCDPVWRQWITTEIMNGSIAAPDFETNHEDYFSVNWLPPKTAWVDPLKDAQAEIVAINAGLMSRRQAVAARGYDLEQIDAEISRDRAQAKAMGLEFGVPPTQGNQEAQHND